MRAEAAHSKTPLRRAGEATGTNHSPQQATDRASLPAAQHKNHARRLADPSGPGVRLTAAGDTGAAPGRKVFAVVRPDAVAVFADTRACARNDNDGRELRFSRRSHPQLVPVQEF